MAVRRQGGVWSRALSALVVFSAVGGSVAPAVAAPPPEVDGPEPVEWWDDLLAAGEDPGEEYVSPPVEPAESAPEIESTPRDMSSLAPVLPAPGAAEVTLGARGVAGRAGSTPVRLSAGSGAAVGETVRVEVLDRETAERAGVRGFVFRLSGKAGAALPASEELPATLTVDYSSFASMFGGGYADRLQVVALPECAVADPVPADCDRAGAVLASRNDHAAQQLVVSVEDLAEVQDATAATSAAPADEAPGEETPAPTTSTTGPAEDEADVRAETGGTAIEPASVSSVRELETAASAQSGQAGVVLALMAGPEGEGGSFKATPLSVTGDWQVGVGSGEFSWNYGIPIPAAVAGPTPDVNLSYSSGAVDGLVTSRNSQAGPAGLGWSDFADSFIERRYNGCQDEGETYGDLCWASDNASISLNGQSSELIQSPSDPNAWGLKADPRWRVQRLFHPNPSDPNASNGDNDGEYWKVTTPDGTQYWFGIHVGPTAGGTGWHTNSTWTVPVVGNDPASGSTPAEPCFAETFHLCRQAWRWNLDWVIDPNGNMQTFLYEPEGDRYLAVNGTDEDYIRAGYLTDIYYSRRSDDFSVQPARVTFASNYRCGTLDAPGTDPCVAPHLADWDQSLYPDVPLDLHCDNNCTQGSPTFWSTKRYTQVDVCVEGAHEGNCALIDSVELTHSLEDADGDTGTTEDTKLFLTGLQRTGFEPGPPGTDPAPDASLTLPPTTFEPVVKNNRHAPGAGESAMPHFRIGSVKDEFGREVEVTYGQPHPCANPLPSPPEWDLNTKNCFPQLWAPEGETPTFRAFNKYLVTQVEVNDTTGGSPSMVTDYLYGNQINGAGGAPQTWDGGRDQAEGAWHHDDDPYLAQANQSWSEWRGYQDVLVRQGDIRTRYKLYRGMDDDQFQNPAPGGLRNVTISSLDGTVTNTPDSNWLAGRVLDEMALRPDGTPEHGTVHGYQASVTVNTPCSPTPCTDPADDPHDARWVAENDTTVRRRTPAAGTVFRRQRTQTTYNGLLLFPEQVIEHGWTDASGDERCTRTEYVINFAAFMLDFPQRVTRYDNGTGCSGSAITRSETAYDGAAVGAAPVKGNPTTNRVQVSSSPSPAGTWTTTTTTFDALGRVHVVTDPNGRATTTTFNGNSDMPGYPYEVKVANDLGHETETRLFLVRGVPAWSDDANDKRTTFAYDPLGRITSVWQPTESTGGSASWQFSYDIDAERDEVPVVRTRQLQDTAGSGGAARYLDTWVLYDSLLRERQTHLPSPESGNVIVADTLYDNRGLVSSKNLPEAVAVTGTFGNALVATPANGWRNRTQSFYDHIGRPVWELFFADDADADLLANNGQRSTTTAYTHETTEVDPFVGGNTRTKADGLGRTIEVAEHDGTAYRTTTYGYDKADRLQTVTDPANNTISYTYDMAGRRLTMDDPDAGDWEYGYDPAGNQTSMTDALEEVTATVYDELNRPVERRADSSTGDLLASWDYDAAGELGLLDKSTRVTAAGDWVVDVAGYDARNRPTGRSWTIPADITGLSGGTPATFGPVTYGYDAADHMTSVGYPAVGGLAAETVTTTFDAVGLPRTMAGATDYVSITAYDNRARPALFGFGPISALAMGKAWGYDLNQQLSSMQATGTGGVQTQNRTIAYDLAGNIIERSTTLSGAAFKECFGYDPRNRLITAYTTTPATTCASGSNKGQGANPYNHTYSYTVDGNLDERNESGTVIEYAYPAGGTGSTRPHAPTDVGANDYTWDANGNQATRTIGGQTETLIWDAEHQLAMVDDPDGDSAFTYDADGARLLRQTPAGTTLYIEGHEITAPAGGGATTAVRSYGFGGQPVATRAPSGVDYVVTDNQGSVEQTIPAGATTAEHTRTYFPYGKLRSGGQPDTDHSWIGQIEDDATGLNYLNARYYDPTAGVFTAPDPLAAPSTPQSYNPYAYAQGKPTMLGDPSGLTPCLPDDCSSVGFVETPVITGIGAAIAQAAGAAAAAVGVGVAAAAVAAVALAGVDLPDLPNLPDLPGRLPDLPDLPNLPKVPSFCRGPIAIGDCGPSLETVARAAALTKKIFDGTNVSLDLRRAFYEGLVENKNWDDDGNIYMVADSNVFQTRPGSPGARAFFDAILASPIVNLYVTDKAAGEVNPGDTWRMYSSVAKVRIVRNPRVPSDFSETGNFDDVDATVVQLAKSMNMPVLTANKAMPRQIASNPDLCRSCGWTSVQFIVPQT